MTEHTNENPSTNPNVEKLLHDLMTQVSALTATVSAWINETKGDAGSGCTKKCQTIPVTPEGVQIAPVKRRGRPPKAVANENATVAHIDPSLDTPAPAKRRGRPPKVKTEAEIEAEANTAPKRRGRPPKAITTAPSTTTVEVQATTGATPAKRRGRPPKAAVTTPAVATPDVNALSEEEEAWQEVDSEKEEVNIPNAPTSMPPAFTSATPPPMPPPAFPPGLPVFPLA